MSDCANVEMRELLPELAAGSLNAATRARVERHVATCADCASELETLRLVRTSFAAAPGVDVRRIVAALPKPATAAQPLRPATPVKRWLDWRIAAALTTITVGGLSLAVAERMNPPSGREVSPPVVVPGPRVNPPSRVASPPNDVSVGRQSSRDSGRGRPASAAHASPTAGVQLSFGGGVGDLDEASLRSLLGALDEIDRGPVAPSAEPDRTPVLPIIQEGDR